MVSLYAFTQVKFILSLAEVRKRTCEIHDQKGEHSVKANL